MIVLPRTAGIGVRGDKTALSRSFGATGAVPLRFRLPNMNLTETGMSTSALAPAAQDEIATLFVGFELSKATWLIGLYSPQLARPSVVTKLTGATLTPPWNGSRLPDSGWRNSVSRSAWYRFTKPGTTGFGCTAG